MSNSRLMQVNNKYIYEDIDQQSYHACGGLKVDVLASSNSYSFALTLTANSWANADLIVSSLSTWDPFLPARFDIFVDWDS